MNFEPGEAFAQNLDAQDPLASFRNEFWIPKRENGQDYIYFSGNSLGLQPKNLEASVLKELRSWARLGVGGYTLGSEPWLRYAEPIHESVARVVGAKSSEVVCMNSLTTNLHLMLSSFYRPTEGRHKILMEDHAFSSDRYAVMSHLRLHGLDPKTSLVLVRPRPGEHVLRAEDLDQRIEKEGSSISMILFGGVNYYTGQLFDMARIVAAAHEEGIPVGFDLAHAAGNVILRLHDWQVDFAVWCSYKYLNSGPGSVGGCFIHEKWARDKTLPRLAGWCGNERSTRYQMLEDFQPAVGAEGWQLSHHPILALASLRASLDVFERAKMERIREKSVQLTNYLAWLLSSPSTEAYELLTPEGHRDRGAQLSIRPRENGESLHQHLLAQGIVCDWRAPDVIRVAPAPLYNTYQDVFRFSDVFRKAVS